MLDTYSFRRAAKTTAPIFFGYIAIGIPFGLMVVNAGYPWWLALVMSLTIYSGTGEYMAVGLFAAGAPLTAIIITEFFVSVRHIVYGLSLLEKYSGVGRWKIPLVFLLTDETYALTSTCSVPEGADKGSYYGTISVLNWSYWNIGSVIGALAGTLLPFSFAGVDFALTSLFIVLMINQIRQTKDFFPTIAGIGTSLAAVILSRFGILPGQHILIVALALGIAILIFVRGIFGAKKNGKIEKSNNDGEETK